MNRPSPTLSSPTANTVEAANTPMLPVGGELAIEPRDELLGLHEALDGADEAPLGVEQQQGRQRVGAKAPLQLGSGAAVFDIDAQQDETLGVALEALLGEDLALTLRPGDLLVVNDSKVLPARIPAKRASGGSEDLPVPLRPISATRSPGSSMKSVWSRSGTWP